MAMGDNVEIADLKQQIMSEMLKVGDTIVYARYGGTEVKIDGEDLPIINETDILGIVK